MWHSNPETLTKVAVSKNEYYTYWSGLWSSKSVRSLMCVKWAKRKGGLCAVHDPHKYENFVSHANSHSIFQYHLNSAPESSYFHRNVGINSNCSRVDYCSCLEYVILISDILTRGRLFSKQLNLTHKSPFLKTCQGINFISQNITLRIWHCLYLFFISSTSSFTELSPRCFVFTIQHMRFYKCT